MMTMRMKTVQVIICEPSQFDEDFKIVFLRLSRHKRTHEHQVPTQVGDNRSATPKQS